MKILETLSFENLSALLELKGGAQSAPHYNATLKRPGGSVQDWYDKMGVEPEHVKEAVSKAKELASYKALAKELKAGEGEKQRKNGTLGFTTDEATYYVYGNGVIRRESKEHRSSSRPAGWTTKLRAPKPALVAGSPVKSLVKIYDNAFKELIKKFKLELNESLESKIPMNARGWELYTSMGAKANAAGKGLGTLLIKKISQTPKGLLDDSKDYLAGGYEKRMKGLGAHAKKIRDEMYKEMDKYREFGARDTEPESILVAVIEAALNLPEYSLDR